MSVAERHPPKAYPVLPQGDVWVFAYGSLMWKPGFNPAESRSALLRGYHRAFCIRSVLYRGTPETPGLVLGLDRGGACRGVAHRIAARDRDTVLRYLWDREMVYDAYAVRVLPIFPEGRPPVQAICFVANPGDDFYAGRLGPDHIAEVIGRGHGASGSNIEYVRETARHLDELGIRTGAVHDVLRLLDRDRGA
jgi:cation transport protein ChaC